MLAPVAPRAPPPLVAPGPCWPNPASFSKSPGATVVGFSTDLVLEPPDFTLDPPDFVGFSTDFVLDTFDVLDLPLCGGLTRSGRQPRLSMSLGTYVRLLSELPLPVPLPRPLLPLL